MRTPLSHSRHGIALVIVLSMIVLITVLVVSFTSSMRTERQASHTMTENERTKLVAEAALAHAISILSSNIPQPVPPIQPGSAVPTPTPANWSVNPGLLNIITGPANVTQVPLSSNPSAAYVSSTSDANLNQLQVNSSQYPILGTSDPMYVAWVPLLQTPAAAATATNPIVARYAFWMDDENAKINVNTAYGKPPLGMPPSGLDYTSVETGGITEKASPAVGPNDVVPLGHPGSVNLDVLGATSDFPAALLSFLKTHGAAKSPEVVKAVLAGTDASKETFYQQSKFSLTATSRAPEFNVFGKSRIFMYTGPTGQLDTALGGGMFQRFRDLDAPMYFHGNENSSASAKDQAALYYTAANLSNVFARRDWPGMPAVSFVDKWDKDANGNAYPGLAAGDMGKREADQTAWNIVTMGSFSDCGSYSTATPATFAKFGNAIPPGSTGSSGSVNYPNAAACLGSLSGKAIVPTAPRPMVDEICLNVLPEPNTGGTGYYLKFAMSYGVWLPPGYPAVDFAQTLSDGTSCDFLVGLTHLEYTVKAEDGSKSGTQKDNKYFASADSNEGIKTGKALLASGTMSPGQRMELLSIFNKPNDETSVLWYARNGNNGFANNQNGSVLFPHGKVDIDVRMRVYVHNRTPYTSPATQLIPVWDTHDYGASAAPTTFNPADPSMSLQPKAFAPPIDDPNDYIDFSFTLDLNALGATQVTRSLRVADPRTGGLARKIVWVPSWDGGSAATADTDSLLDAHNAETVKAIAAGWQLNKFAYIDMTAGSALPHPSTGVFSLVSTGMQRGIVGSNFKLQPNPNPTTQLPDWLLLDLFAPTVAPPAGSTGWSDIVKMNATAGKTNINAAIYPRGGSFTPPDRLLPLQALFTNTPAGPTVAQNIVNHMPLASGGNTYAGGGKFYNYPGEVCEIKGVADTGATDFDKEATVRNLAGAITTKSNTFCVWGVAQTIKKLPTTHQYGQYEQGDVITGEKRFQAIVERYVWPGADGIAGNGHVSTSGTYDLVTQGATQPGVAPSAATAYNWETLDGPDAPTYPISTNPAPAGDPNNVTTNVQYDPYNKNALSTYTGISTDKIEAANNPVRAVMKYQVIYFKYLD